MLEYIEVGIHTFELSQPLSKNQFNEVLNQIRTRGQLFHTKKGQESYTLRDKQMPGVQIILYRIKKRHTYRVSIIVEPCRILGSNIPTELYHYDKESYKALKKHLNHYLEEMCIPGKLENMPISRCDLTCNMVFCSQDYVDAYLRILKKSCLIPKYQVDHFKNNEKKAKDPQRASQHTYCIRCKQASFLCYDKINQLEMTGRCPERLDDLAILRLEAQLKRPSLKRALDKRAWESNDKILKAASGQAALVISSYLNRMFSCSGTHLRYEDAVSAIRKVKKEKRREPMLSLLRKVSDSATLDNAARKLDVSDKKLKKLYEEFDKQGVNPITLPNSSSIAKIPPLNKLLRKQNILAK